MATSSLPLSSQLLVGELVKRASHRAPNMVGYVYEDERRTHMEMDQRATQMAAWLQAQGIKKDEKVGYIMKNSLALVEVLFGIALSGGVGVPINFRLTAAEVEYIINHSDSKLLIIDEEYVEMIQSIRAKLPQVEMIIVYGKRAVPSNYINYESIFEANVTYTPCPDLIDDDPAMIVYTSGTTGRPKGAVLTHKNFCINSLNMMWEGHGQWHDSMLAVIPLFHSAGIMIIIRNAICVGKMVIHRDFKPVAVLETIQEEKINGIALVPAMWNFLFQVPNMEQYDVSSVTKCTVGAAITPLELKKRILNFFSNASLIDTFGQTETTTSTTCLYGEDALRKTTSAGRSTINVEVRVVDDEMNDVPIGEVGEIIYRGPTVMKEYYKNSEATTEAFKGGWFHSGDLVKLDEEGFIYVVDRKKDMIISGGENIYPAEIEEVLYTHPAILECAVIGVPDPTWGENVKACIVRKPDTKLSADDVIAFCTERLATYKKPKEVEFLDVLPRNASGKVLKTVLRERAAEGTK